MHELTKRSGALLMVGLLLCPVGAVATGLDPVDTLLGGLEKRATTVVENAGAQGRGVAMEAGQAALNAIGAFRAAHADALGKTLAGLTDQQRKAYEHLAALLDRAETGVRASLAETKQLTEQLNHAAAATIGGKRVPLLQHLAPQYFVAQPGKGLRITLSGLYLATGTPHLRLAGRDLRPSTSLDNRLVFELPAEALVTDAAGQTVQAELMVFERRSRFLSWIWPDVPRTYRVALFSLPSKVGSYVLTAKREVAGVEAEARRSGDFRCDSPRGEGSNTVPVHVTPREGWQIDTQSIVYNRTYSNHGSHTFHTQSAQGFTAQLRCEGWDRVVVAGVVVNAGQIGVETGFYTYREFRASTTTVLAEVRAGDLGWEETLVVPDLPPDTKTVTLAFKPFNGVDTAAQGTDHTNRFFTLDYNDAQKTATLAARKAENVMGS